MVVYRLLTCGTVEEKIYRKQIYKQFLIKTATESSHNYRYFTKQELKAMFVLDNPRVSQTQRQLAGLHPADHFEDDPLVKRHVDFLMGSEGELV